MPLETVYSVCPHDCPSACALAVERLASEFCVDPGLPQGGAVFHDTSVWLRAA